MTRRGRLCQVLGAEVSRQEEALSNSKLSLHLFAIMFGPLTSPAPSPGLQLGVFKCNPMVGIPGE